MKSMMMNLKRNSNSNSNSNNNQSRSCTKPFSPPRKNKSRYSNYSAEGDEEELLPDMIDSPSGSIDTISSGEQQQQQQQQQPPQQHVPPPLYSSSSRMQERFANTLTKARNQQRRRSQQPPPSSQGPGRRPSVSPLRPRRRKSGTTAAVDEPSNSSILMGADIIKRQLSGESPTRHRPQPQQQYELYDPSESPMTNPYRFRTSRATHAFSSSLDRENWDPWKTDEEEIQKKNHNSNSSNSNNNNKNDSPDYSKDLFTTSSSNNNSIISDSLRARLLDYSKDSSLAASTKACSSRAQEILSNGDDYFDMRNNAISKSTALAEAAACAAKNVEYTMKNANANIQANVNMNAIANANPAKCMVQRLSELDDSTFASSTGSNGYLPSKLLTGLTCGALNNPLIANCSTPPQPTTSALPSSPRTAAETTIPNEEELETSTLDFLANLHVKEEDLNFVFTNLENEEDLCAGAAAVAQTAAEHMPWNTGKNATANSNSNATATTKSNKEQLTSSSYVTAACTPFEKMLSSRSSLHDELMKDPGYQHALKAGTLWQSLCSQHVRFPAHWWDGQEPHGPPMGSSKKRSKPWSYLGRHRVQGDSKLNYLIGNRSSSGRILLHLIVRDEISGEPMEDICCGCFHPNARGIRTTHHFDPNLEDCRDVWIAHRRRFYDISEGDAADKEEETTASSFSSWPATTIESLLRHQNKGRIHPSPLGAQGGKHSVNNDNLRTVFGSKPPVYTVFCLESDLFELFQSQLDGSIPASVALLRHYLRYSQMK